MFSLFFLLFTHGLRALVGLFYLFVGISLVPSTSLNIIYVYVCIYIVWGEYYTLLLTDTLGCVL